MKSIRSSLLFLVVLSSAITSGADEGARPIDLHGLVAEMSLEEKIGQLALRGRGSSGSHAALSTELVDAVRAGRVGSVINLMVGEDVDRLQRIAIEESPHGIPLLFGRDVIHGLHAVSPIPLGQAATWNPALVREGARAAARDASRYGVRWTFAPMLDIARDPRWGRIAESLGEDPFLASRLGEAMVRGFQGDDLADPTSIAACAKHFAAYGAAEGGRDYNTVSLSESDLRNVYLRPFEAAVAAGAATLMSAFNEFNGIPATAHHLLLTEILRDEWAFEGFVVSDWNSVTEMIAHGFSADARQAAQQAISAGLDQEMMSRAFEDHLAELVADGEVSIEAIDDAVLRILETKARLGLFDRPYRAEEGDPAALREDSLDIAHRLALESAVLLKNDGLLPIAPSADLRVAVIGPLADNPHEQLGTWAFDGRADESRTPLATLRERLGEQSVLFAAGLDHSRSTSYAGFAEAVDTANEADVVLFFGGEEAILSGEAHSRADIGLPGDQQELLGALAETETPIVLILMSGRPITLHEVIGDVEAVLAAWHPGTMAGPAIVDLLLGEVTPSGRLPVSWPKTVGQVPIHYNHKATGRPADPVELIDIKDIPVGAWQSSLSNTSHYLDAGIEPEFPFGFGLTYTTFEYLNLEVSPAKVEIGGDLVITAEVANTGPVEATETVQLYFRDLVASRTRPVRELSGFKRITLGPGDATKVSFELSTDDLAFFDGESWVTESGVFSVWIAPHALGGLEGSFEVADATQSNPASLVSARPAGFVERLDPRLDALVPPDATPVVLAAGFNWSEGPVWVESEDSLLFSDVPRNTIFRWRPGVGLDLWLEPSGYTGDVARGGGLGGNGLLLDRNGDLLLCQHGDRRLARLTLPLSGSPVFETVVNRFDGARFNSPNDLVLSSRGDLYFTDPPYGLEHGPDDPARELSFNGVYRLTSSGELTLVTDELTRPNGIALSPDERTLYVANSDPDRAIWMAYEVEEDGGVGEGVVFFDATALVSSRPGLPDGMVVDSGGHLFATGPGGVFVFSPEGEHLGTIRFNGPTANCTFGDQGSTLYVTAGDKLARVRTRARGLGFD